MSDQGTLFLDDDPPDPRRDDPIAIDGHGHRLGVGAKRLVDLGRLDLVSLGELELWEHAECSKQRQRNTPCDRRVGLWPPVAVTPGTFPIAVSSGRGGPFLECE